MKFCCLLLCFLPLQFFAQTGYNQWLSVQGTEIHLLADYKEKKVYGSESGTKEDMVLKQVQTFEKGRMVRDILYKNYPSEVLFDMIMDYSDEENAVGTNLLDSSKVSYSFTKEKKLHYYVVDRQSEMHVIYTYDEDGLLIKCKDCLAPFGGHEWCAYFKYAYNEKKQLERVESYNLEKGKPVNSKTLYSIDSLVYEEGLLKERLTLNPAGAAIQKATYSYNSKSQLEKEESTQLPPFVEPRGYTKSYQYHCNKKLKKQEEVYYTNKELQGTQIMYFDKKGRKVKQESIRGDGKRTKLYEMKYK